MVVIAQKYGQLGNRLFLFAHFAAAAIEHGFRVANPAFEEYARSFEATARDPLCRFPPRPSPLAGPLPRKLAYAAAARAAGALHRIGRGVVRLRGEETLDIGAPEFVARARRGLLFVQGWGFRDAASLERHADEVRSFLRPRDEALAAAERALVAAREPGAPLVGVHVRRGDYARFAGGRYHWDDATYRRLIELVRERLPSEPSFLLCSDERVDAAAFAGLPAAFGPGDAVGDLHALAGCDYLLGPPSTFTAWASFYGGVPLGVVENPLDPPPLDRFGVVRS